MQASEGESCRVALNSLCSNLHLFILYFFTSYALPDDTMSAQDAEDLIDYEDEHDVVSGGAAASATNGGIGGAGDDKEKKNFSGIHSTGFRYAVFHFD